MMSVRFFLLDDSETVFRFFKHVNHPVAPTIKLLVVLLAFGMRLYVGQTAAHSFLKTHRGLETGYHAFQFRAVENH